MAEMPREALITRVIIPAADDGLDREDLANELEAFYGDSAKDCGAGSGKAGFSMISPCSSSHQSFLSNAHF